MPSFELRSLNEIVAETPGLLANGAWACINIETRAPWPSKPQSFEFEGHEVWVIPLSTDHYPGLATKLAIDLERVEGFALLHRALSVLTWLQNTGAVVTYMTGGNLPRMMGRQRSSGNALRDEFDLSDLPILVNPVAKLALALIREGRGLNHPGYSFLSFYRALEAAIPDGQARGAWVTANIDRIEGHRAKDALVKLKAEVDGDIGTHLRDSGRHAIAHARGDPIINPDDPRDARRLEAERPIIEALAVLAVEERLGVDTSQKAWREHLYELRGWKKILPAAVIEASLLAQPPELQFDIDIPQINFRLRRSDPFPLLEGMEPVHAGLINQRIELVYRSVDGLVDIIFWLNFKDERLEFDLDKSFRVYEDGSAAAAKNGKERSRFIWEYFCNGEIQIWNAVDGTLISRVDAFIPVNMVANLDAHVAEQAAWDKMISDREQAEGVDQ